jgi:hypothetical protein
MKKYFFFFFFLLLFPMTSWGQSPFQGKREIQINYLTEFDVNGNRYGLAMEINQFIVNKNQKNYSLKAGIFNEFFVKNEKDIEGISGNTFSNQLGLTLSNSLTLLKSRKLLFSNTLYTGWGFRRTKANYINKSFNIDRDFSSQYSYLALGMYWKLGWQLKEKWALQLIGKTDFSRVFGPYEATLFERPGFMYGIGFIYNL